MTGPNTRSAIREAPDDTAHSSKRLKLIGPTSSGGSSSLPSPASSPSKPATILIAPRPSDAANEADSEGTISNDGSPPPAKPLEESGPNLTSSAVVHGNDVASVLGPLGLEFAISMAPSVGSTNPAATGPPSSQSPFPQVISLASSVAISPSVSTANHCLSGLTVSVISNDDSTKSVDSGSSTSVAMVQSRKGHVLVMGLSKCILAVLPHVTEHALVYSQDEVSLVPPFMINNYLRGNRALTGCMFNLAIHLEGYNMVNLFVADPQLYHTGSYNDSKQVLSKDKTEPSFFMVRHVTSSSLFEGLFTHKIHIQPLACTWPCQHAALSQMLGMCNIVIATYKGGIQFSTMRKPYSGGREMQPKSIPMDGLTHGPPIRPWNVNVPMFRGVEPFQLKDYTKLELEEDELSEGDFILIVFMAAAYKSRKSFNIASLNLQLVIRLAEYNVGDTIEGSAPLPDYLLDETLLGVDKTTMMEIPVEELLFDSEVEVPGSDDAPMM